MNKVEKCKIDNYSTRRPVFIKDLVYFILDIFENNMFGIHCFYNPYDNYTKYGIAQLAAKYLNKNMNHTHFYFL